MLLFATVLQACSEATPAPPVDSGTGPIDGVRIRVSDDARAVVNAHPAGTTFIFETGIHRLTAPITPRTGDTFVGDTDAILNGSQLLTSFNREGDLWVATGQTQQGWRHPGAYCESADSRCLYPENLYLDDTPLHHVTNLNAVESGTWFFDYDNDRIYFADDPTGKKVETSVTDYAFHSDADDVTIRDLTIEKFANYAQRGVILSRVFHRTHQTYGHHWVIENNLIQLNHGAGITAGHGARIINNRVLRNGHIGINGGWGRNTLVEGNEIAYNNWAGFRWTWEAGGAKWYYSDGLVVRNNHVHHNVGPGLWTDIDTINTLYEHNLVEHNTAVGIFHEISYAATIRHNMVRYNGIGPGYEQHVYVFGSGILISSSSDVTVYRNVLQGNWGGIAALQSNRGVGQHGTYHVRNLHVHDNDVEMTYWEDGYSGSGTPTGVASMTGLFRAGGPTDIWDEEANNRFEGNRYTITSGTSEHWHWQGSRRDFTTWQALGNDQTGQLCTTAPTVMACN